eukprot:scaffold177801_cov28-Tisochrysis_lutea.AAC.7
MAPTVRSITTPCLSRSLRSCRRRRSSDDRQDGNADVEDSTLSSGAIAWPSLACWPPHSRPEFESRLWLSNRRHSSNTS